MAGNDLFEAEEAALRAAASVHAQSELDASAYREALGVLVADFRRLVRETRRVIIHSDRQERELNRLNTALQQLASELDYKSKHDPLTGIFNRRAIIEYTESRLREGSAALIVLDIDHFKRINDEHGHPAGDAVIVELVQRLRAVVPAQGAIGRVGGEEFTVVLPEVTLADATQLAQAMRECVAAEPFGAPCGQTVTASFGVSQTSLGSRFDDVFGRADAALYQAKRNGRNAVVSA